MPSNSMLEIGVRTIAIKTTGHEKARFTVVLGARATGPKCIPWSHSRVKGKALDRLTGVVINMQEPVMGITAGHRPNADQLAWRAGQTCTGRPLRPAIQVIEMSALAQ